MTDDSDDLGAQIASAAENDDAAVAASAIRGGDFIVFQQIDPENPQSGDDEGAFSVVLAQVEEDTAVVCFSNKETAQMFAEEIADEIPPGQELPALMLAGDVLLDGLPDDCGLLVNPGSELECYFPPGILP